MLVHEPVAALAPARPPVAALAPAPGARWSSHRHPAARFLAAGRRPADAGLRVVVSGASRERPLVADTGVGVPGVLALAHDLDGLAAPLAGSEVVVAASAGGVHPADAVGTSVVDVAAKTAEEYRPRPVSAVVLTRPTTCAPCRRLVCPFDHDCHDVSAS